MITTAELQALTAPVLEQVFAALGHDLVVVRAGAGTGGWTADGKRVKGEGSRVSVRGLLLPAESRDVYQASESGLPVPRYLAYLPFSAPVDQPGFHLEHAGVRYYLRGLPRNEGNQGIVWVVPLGAPGEQST